MLIAFCGSLGTGKTLGLTWLGNLWFKRGYTIYSNYKLKFPFTPVTEFKDIENMKGGFASLDELWLWLDSRMSSSLRNRAIGEILLKSRKRDINIGYTAQSFRQVDVRLRHITDYLVSPFMTRRNRICILKFYSNPPANRPIMTRKFKTEEYFKMYDTREEIKKVEYEKGKSV